MQRAIACSPCRCRARAGAAGVLRQIPGVAGKAVQAGEAGTQHAEVRACGLGIEDRAILAQARRQRRVFDCGRHVGSSGASRHRIALHGNVVLDADRHAIQRANGCALDPAGFGCPRRLHRFIRTEIIKSANPWLTIFNSCDKRRHILGRRETARFEGREHAAGRKGQNLVFRAHPLVRIHHRHACLLCPHMLSSACHGLRLHDFAAHTQRRS